MSTPDTHSNRILRFLGSPPQHTPSKIKPKPTETMRKTMQVALPTFAIIAAAYIFLSHLPLVALAISAAAVSSALVISYYLIVKPLFYPSNLDSPSGSPPNLGFNRKRRGNGAVSAPHLGNLR